MNLLSTYKKLIKPTKDIPVADLSQHRDSKGAVVDLSHHRTKEHIPKKSIKESTESWLSDHDSADIAAHHEPLEQEHASNLKPEHHRAIEAIINGGLEDGDETGSRRVNNDLIEAHNTGRPHEPEHVFGDDEDNKRYLKISTLDDALKQNKLKKKLTTYSGLGFDPRTKTDATGKIFNPGYTFSSTDPNRAHKYATPIYNKETDKMEYHIARIEHPVGSTGMYVGNNEDYSPFYDSEHIAPRGTTLLKIGEESHTNKNGRLTIIHKYRRITK
jgi:hypothetical protein